MDEESSLVYGLEWLCRHASSTCAPWLQWFLKRPFVFCLVQFQQMAV